MKRKTRYKFNVGDRVKSTFNDVAGIVIARFRYSKQAEQFYYSAGKAVYAVEFPSVTGLIVFLEDYLESA
jgi:hypothetical protein